MDSFLYEKVTHILTGGNPYIVTLCGLWCLLYSDDSFYMKGMVIVLNK